MVNRRTFVLASLASQAVLASQTWAQSAPERGGSPSPAPDVGTAPLTVLFSFLSRADPTPLDQRSRASGHIFDKDGKVISDPAADPSANAFEPNPNLNFEHWGDYWRKVHGVRFLHPDEADDQKAIDRPVALRSDLPCGTRADEPEPAALPAAAGCERPALRH